MPCIQLMYAPKETMAIYVLTYNEYVCVFRYCIALTTLTLSYAKHCELHFCINHVHVLLFFLTIRYDRDAKHWGVKFMPLNRVPLSLVLTPHLPLPKTSLEQSVMQLVLNIPSREMQEPEDREMSSEVEEAQPLITQLGAQVIGSKRMAELLQSGNLEKTLIIDSRSFVEYNSSHILRSKNVVCSKLVKRRLLLDKVSIQNLMSLLDNLALNTEFYIDFLHKIDFMSETCNN